MKRVYITTLFRDNVKEYGNFYVIDWDTKEKLYFGTFASKSQGGHSVGLRGLWQNGDYVWFLDGQDSAYIYGKFENRISPEGRINLCDFVPSLSNQFNGIHQACFFIKNNQFKVQVACAGTDEIIEFFDYGFTLWRKISLNEIKDSFLLQNLDSSKKFGEDKLHINSINIHPVTGDIYHVYHNPACVYNWTKQEVVFLSPHNPAVLNQPHDIEFTPDGKYFYVSSSANRNVVKFDMNGNPVLFGWKAGGGESTKHNMHGYTRGLAVWEDKLFSCASPGFVRLFASQDSLEEEISITDNPDESIFDISLDYRDFNLNYPVKI